MADWTEDYSERFDELRRNRVQLSRLKYGRAEKNFKTGNVNAIETMLLCVEKYRSTGNTEYLCDGANYLMFEFMFPQERISAPRIPMRARASSASARRKWKSSKIRTTERKRKHEQDWN